MNTPKVTFGIVNCNRLHYMRSCLESLLYCTDSYDNKEIIIVDNASVEQGTSEYLDEKEKQGIIVIRQEKRDPSNEFAKGLNAIIENSTGEYICPLQGDMQFIVRGTWLHEYVNFFSENENITGCIMLDAQRSVRNGADKYSEPMGQQFKFVYNLTRNPINAAGDVMFSRKMIEQIYPWSESNTNHEGGGDSETKMLEKVAKIIGGYIIGPFCAMPILPIAVTINTDPRGTNARVRGNKRYGAYWPPKTDYRYYEIYELDDFKKSLSLYFDFSNALAPVGVEHVANPIGWKKPVDPSGNWLKNPINPETAIPSDYTVLYEETSVNVVDEVYLDEWLDS